MASDAFPADSGAALERVRARSASEPLTNWQMVCLILKPVASLKITVALFFMLIVLLFIGTLAQAEEAMWSAVARYFHSAFVWIEFKTLFPKSFFPGVNITSSLGFPFLGGGTIGVLLLINLLSAHLIRFKIQATGMRLAVGLLVIFFGLLFTAFVVVGHLLMRLISSSHSTGGLQDVPWFVEMNGGDWGVFWLAIKYGILPLTALAIGGVAVWFVASGRRKIEPMLLFALDAICVVGAFLLIAVYPYAQLDDSALRILWQLLQSGLAGVVLLIGCILVFKQRGGIVVIHGGVVLLILGMFYVAMFAIEEQTTIPEGGSSSTAQDIREVELAVVDRRGDDSGTVIAIPQSRLESKQKISHKQLPFDVQLVEFLPNSEIVYHDAGTSNLATEGFGRRFVAKPKRVSAGADSGGKVDNASAYVKISKGKDVLGTYLFSQATLAAGPMESEEKLPPEKITVGGKTYDVALRFKTSYKDYTIHLKDVRKDDYMGTDMPMNYSSDIRLVTDDGSEDRAVRIWMNNPLRYGGETFYQTSYFFDGQTEYTQLSIVTNTGWMVPYLGCMIVAIGLGAHFWMTMVRFLNRLMAGDLAVSGGSAVAAAEIATTRPPKPGQSRNRPRRVKRRDEATTSASLSAGGIIVPAIVVAVALICVANVSRVPDAPSGKIDYYAAGTLPVMYQGRVKPLDTLARNALRIISDRETFVDKSGRGELDDESAKKPAKKDIAGETRPAIVWLLDVISGHPRADEHEVFRIDNFEVLDVLELDRRKGFRYSVTELRENITEFEKQVRRVSQLDAEKRGTFELKLLETDRRIRTYTQLLGAFRPHRNLPPLPTPDEFERNRAAAMQKVAVFRQELLAAKRAVNSTNPPLVVPGAKPGEPWQPYSNAWLDLYVMRTILGESGDENAETWEKTLAAYANDNAESFNLSVAGYRDQLEVAPPKEVDLSKIDREAYYNNFNPFLVCRIFYIASFVITCVGLLCIMFRWNMPFNRAGLALILLTFAIHSLALLARMYISGRPPVTNLYSSAVAIGWLAVAFGIAIEFMTRIGIGNLISAKAGIATTIIAYNLAGDGDTMAVLQAVLDTQFWLATHVVSITAGYATTFVAGKLAILFILGGVCTPLITKQVERILYKLMFGVVCFAMFFSFFGTVLGGLWADDSWGRFWGWDPKENGALIIVMWNALLLHARWGGMVKARGFAVLAVIGNIVTAWSWFGVNELGVGLHSYGFTDGVLLALGIFGASQIAIMGIGLLPKDLWLSYREQRRQQEQFGGNATQGGDN